MIHGWKKGAINSDWYRLGTNTRNLIIVLRLHLIAQLHQRRKKQGFRLHTHDVCHMHEKQLNSRN